MQSTYVSLTGIIPEGTPRTTDYSKETALPAKQGQGVCVSAGCALVEFGESFMKHRSLTGNNELSGFLITGDSSLRKHE